METEFVFDVLQDCPSTSATMRRRCANRPCRRRRRGDSHGAWRPCSLGRIPCRPLRRRDRAFGKAATGWCAMLGRGHPPPPRERPRSSTRTRSEEHTSELQSLMRISYAVFCLKKKNKQINDTIETSK